MKKENTVCFRVTVYDCDSHEMWDHLKPASAKSSAWIPQTIGDQVWMWFEFNNKEERDHYVDNLLPFKGKFTWSEGGKGMIVEKSKDVVIDPKTLFMNVSQEDLDYWTK